MPHNTIKIAFAKEAPLHRNCSWQLLLFQMHIPKAKLGIHKMMIEVTHFHHQKDIFKCTTTPQELQTMLHEPRYLLLKSGRVPGVDAPGSIFSRRMSADRVFCQVFFYLQTCAFPLHHQPCACLHMICIVCFPPVHAISVCIFSSHPRLPPHIVVF